MASERGHVEGCCVVDLGAGTGRLAIASLLWGAEHVILIDTDADALRKAHANILTLLPDHLSRCTFIKADISELSFDPSTGLIQFPTPTMDSQELDVHEDLDIVKFADPPVHVTRIDTVMMNPPFGTRNKAADVRFLQCALQLAPVVYSLHKSVTRPYLTRRFKAEILAQIKFSLPPTHVWHKRDRHTIDVDFICCARQ